eukprot:jgi/Bigna1/80495/fgenesh1_pg.71_\
MEVAEASYTDNPKGVISGSQSWEKACLTILGASTTGPMYTVMYMSGWLKQHQGNSIVLELFITFYPLALGILLLQVCFDHIIDEILGRWTCNMLRFGVTSIMNALLLPLIYMYANDTMSLWVIFALMGFSHGVALGSSFELCLHMPRRCKGIEYLNVGLQVGGVATGIFGVLSGFTLQEHPQSYHFYGFALLTSMLCLSGFGAVMLLHFYSDIYAKVMKIQPEPPPASLWEVLVVAARTSLYFACLYSRHAANIWGYTSVQWVYVNLCSDLIGRTVTTYFGCPSGMSLLKLVLGRQVLVVVFFIYISQQKFLQDIFILIVLHILMVSHGMFTTWSFVHANSLATVKG